MGAPRRQNSRCSTIAQYIIDHPGCTQADIRMNTKYTSREVSACVFFLCGWHRAERKRIKGGPRSAFTYYPGSNAVKTRCPYCQIRKTDPNDQDGHCPKCAKELKTYAEAYNNGYEQGYLQCKHDLTAKIVESIKSFK